jgi:hypothetical protein
MYKVLLFDRICQTNIHFLYYISLKIHLLKEGNNMKKENKIVNKAQKSEEQKTLSQKIRKKAEIKTEDIQISSLAQKPMEFKKDYIDLDDLIKKAIFQWKKEFEEQEVKTDTIGDLERLIKLKILIKDEKEKNDNIIQELLSMVIEVIKDTVADSDLRVKIYERLKEIQID